MNIDLVNYVEENIFPIYETFDKGHDVNHIKAVIDRALELYSYLNDSSININVLYISAALHDIGILVERKNHALHSQEFVLSCGELRNFFSEEEIKIIGEAVADHSTSKGIEPRSIYGKIVCDADKDNDIYTSLMRAYEYTKNYYPDYTEEECINNVYNQLVFKFGESGKVKFWINSDKQIDFKKTMNKIANDKELFLETMKKAIESFSSPKVK